MNYPLNYQLARISAKLRYYIGLACSAVFKNRQFEIITSPDFNKDFLLAINDACEFLHIDLFGFIDMLNDHSRWPQELWHEVNCDVDEFNRNIVGNIGRKNICANTMCSFALRYTHDTLYSVVKMLGRTHDSIKLCDYGCCNANISFSMLLGGHISSLTMYDLYSESADFIKHRIKKYGVREQAQWKDVNDIVVNDEFDIVYCIDVLEHTVNPSLILETKIAPLLKRNGYLIIQAPWGGGVVSHLDEAIVDFYSQGGKTFLNKHFKKVHSMTPLDISGVWLKK